MRRKIKKRKSISIIKASQDSKARKKVEVPGTHHANLSKVLYPRGTHRVVPQPQALSGRHPQPQTFWRDTSQNSSPVPTGNQYDPLSLPDDTSEITPNADVIMKSETSEEKGERLSSPKKHQGQKNKHKDNTSKIAPAGNKTRPPGSNATPPRSIRKDTAQRRKNKNVGKT